jgi:hypothetical protein
MPHGGGMKWADRAIGMSRLALETIENVFLGSHSEFQPRRVMFCVSGLDQSVRLLARRLLGLIDRDARRLDALN